MIINHEASLPKTILKYILSFVIAVAGSWLLYWLLSWGLYGISSTSNNQSLMKWLADHNAFAPAKSWISDTNIFHDKLNSTTNYPYELSDDQSMNSEMGKEEEDLQSSSTREMEPSRKEENRGRDILEETYPQKRHSNARNRSIYRDKETSSGDLQESSELYP